ncbi:class I SAM-dependent methyltransferase [Actinoplanes auranticolor]|nr:class I SAM-dependent methyltransferase [Actinoplanes auranticolor]
MDELVGHYTAGDEDIRLSLDRNLVEWVRTGELLERWLPAAPATVLDVGGGPGRQARHLLDRGYDVTLYDPVPKHVAQARERGVPAYAGDARRLPAGDATADAVLMLGPLYHLIEADDRARALAEASRVLRPGGVVVAAGLSRWGRILVRAAAEELGDPARHRHTMATLRHGHVEGGDSWDEVAYLHDPGELAAELTTARLHDVEVVGVEGPAGAWARRDPALNAHALELARAAETALAGASIHLLARGTKG